MVSESHFICGIDPGISAGAISLLKDKDLIKTWVLPKGDKGLDLEDLCNIISEIQSIYKPLFVLEEIHSIFGAAVGTMFKMGRGVGNIEATLSCNGCSYILVQPKKWQSKIWLESDIVYKDPSAKRKVKDTKATSLNAVKRLFPNESEKLMYGSNEKISGRRNLFKDGIVDSVLIAYSQI